VPSGLRARSACGGLYSDSPGPRPASPTRSSIDGALFIVQHNIADHFAGVELEPAATALHRKLNRALICCSSVLPVLWCQSTRGRAGDPEALAATGFTDPASLATTGTAGLWPDCVHGTQRTFPRTSGKSVSRGKVSGAAKLVGQDACEVLLTHRLEHCWSCSKYMKEYQYVKHIPYVYI